MEKIITAFKYFIDFSTDNLWSLGDGLEDNFKLYVDNSENQLDQYLNTDYQGTPLWFYFLSYDYCFFDYFKERISLKNDWDYTLLFNIDFIESSQYFISLSDTIYHQKLTPFCPFDVLLSIFRKEINEQSSFNFSVPTYSLEKFSNKVHSDFFKNAKIKFNLSSFSHIINHDHNVGIQILHSIMASDTLNPSFLSQLSISKNEDFFHIKVNLLFHYPDYCQHSFIEKIDAEQLSLFVTDIISQKQLVDKNILFKIMNKEHLILALHTHYFSIQELSNFITDKKIHYHLLDYKLNQIDKPLQFHIKKTKI